MSDSDLKLVNPVEPGEVGEELVQCDCWWSSDSGVPGDAERVSYADFECPVHTREDCDR
jgi:hypothetical protein